LKMLLQTKLSPPLFSALKLKYEFLFHFYFYFWRNIESWIDYVDWKRKQLMCKIIFLQISHTSKYTHTHIFRQMILKFIFLNNPQRVFSVNLGRSVSKYQADLQFFSGCSSRGNLDNSVVILEIIKVLFCCIFECLLALLEIILHQFSG
jgi:hypothetical protein